MIETFLATLSPMLVLFLCILIGYILRIKKILPEYADKVMSKLENFIFVPALCLSTFMNNCTVASLSEHYTIVLYSVGCLAVAILIAVPLSKLFSRNDHYLRCIYKYALTFANFGFMGNAIVPAVLSVADSGILYKYLLFTLPLNVAVYTWGIIILIPKGEKKQNPIKNLLNPIVIGLLIGAIIGLSGTNNYIPQFVVDTIDYLKACMAPVGMILIGFVVGGFPIKEILKNKNVYIATFLRLIVMPFLLLSLLYICKAPKLIMTLALFAYATPLGMNTVVFPTAYGGDSKPGASMALISHTLSVITIPIMYTLFKLLIK